jgi:hypothetical protein
MPANNKRNSTASSAPKSGGGKQQKQGHFQEGVGVTEEQVRVLSAKFAEAVYLGDVAETRRTLAAGADVNTSFKVVVVIVSVVLSSF